MAFNTDSNLDAAGYGAKMVGKPTIPYDADCVSELYYQFPSNTGPIVNNGVTSYNGQELNFDIRIPSNCRVRLDKSYFRVTGHAGTLATDTTAIPVSASIPWNSYAALINKAEVQFNQSAITIESLTQNFGDGNMVKMLTRFSAQALESMSDRFFTPCIETRRDLSVTYTASTGPVTTASSVLTGPAGGGPVSCAAPGGNITFTTLDTVPAVNGLSDESYNRSLRWFGAGGGAGTAPTVSKNLYLADIFDSCNSPAAYFLQQLRIRLTPKQVNEIIFDSNIPAVAQGFWITDVALYLCLTQLTESSISEDIKSIQAGETIFRQSFTAFDAKQTGHESGSSMRYSNVKNLQAIVTLIKSTSPLTSGAGGSVADRRNGVNPYQYVYGFTLPGATATSPAIAGVTQYQYRYENLLSPQYPLGVGLTAATVRSNTNLYAMYRSLTSRIADKEITPALDASKMLIPPTAANGNVDGWDWNPYVMFCAQFYPDEAAFHRTMAGGDLEAIISGGGPVSVVYVHIRTSLLEIRGDTSTYVIN